MITLFLAALDTEDKKSKFERVYNKYIRFVMYLILRKIPDKEAAEDIAGDVFEALAVHIDKVGDIESNKTKAFISVITNNRITDVLRKEKSTLSLDDIKCEPISDADVFERVYVSDIVEQIKNMPEAHRDILILKVYNGLSAKEIAKIYSISQSAARKRVERARQCLLSRLYERGVENDRTEQ